MPISSDQQAATGQPIFRWFKTVFKVLVLLEVSYLVLLNGALWLPQTQDLINDVRPEKFSISWDKAWSWYPFRVHVEGGFANGQSRNQQWQGSAEKVSASISLLPLFSKRVWIDDVYVMNASYRQRPRVRQDRDYSMLVEFFPDIEGWELTDADLTPLPDRLPWYVEIEDIHVVGTHDVWLYQLRGKVEADIEADLKVRSRSGPFSLDAHTVDIQLSDVFINDDREVLQSAGIQGSISFSEFVPRENRGLALLNFLNLDIETSVDMDELDSINLFLMNFDHVSVTGQGAVDGRFRFEQGTVLTGTDIDIQASDLAVDIMAFDLSGNGTVKLTTEEEQAETLVMEFGFDDLDITHKEDVTPILQGDDMTLSIHTTSQIVPEAPDKEDLRSISASIGGLTVPDIPLFQRYLPEKWPFTLHGGSGSLMGSFELTTSSYLIDLVIQSDHADVGIKEYRFDTDLDLAIKLDNPSVLEQGTRIDGTYLKLTDARLQREGSTGSEPAALSVEINDGMLTLFGADRKQGYAGSTDLMEEISTTDMKQLLGGSHGRLSFDASVSSLGWMNVLLGKEHHTKVSGDGEITGELQLDAGFPAPGTDVRIGSDILQVEFLDYEAHGEGNVSLVVEEGGANPDWRVSIHLDDAGLKRKNETEALIGDVELRLTALVEDVSLDDSEKPYTLDLKLLSATVSDMSVFNRYLPPDSPFAFEAGTAGLTADIELQPYDVTGWVRLDARNLDAVIDEHGIGANLLADIRLEGGSPADMMFDINGSSLLLDEVRITGEEQQFDNEDWSASLLLTRGKTTWKSPLTLDLNSKLHMSDSRPLVALFRNGGGSKWLSKLITVEDINGTVELSLADERLVIPKAHVISDNIEIGAKGVIAKAANNGVFFLRYKKLNLILKIQDGDRNVDIIRARKTYDEYRVDR